MVPLDLDKLKTDLIENHVRCNVPCCSQSFFFQLKKALAYDQRSLLISPASIMTA